MLAIQICQREGVKRSLSVKMYVYIGKITQYTLGLVIPTSSGIHYESWNISLVDKREQGRDH